MKGKCYHRARVLLCCRMVLLTCTAANGQTLTPSLPNPKLTPGAVRTTDTKDICSHGTRELRLYNKDRERSHERYAYILHTFNIQEQHIRQKYQLDHLIPLGIGGADEENNLWPQPRDEAELKDRLEFRMRDMVCKEGYPVGKLQEEIRTNWWDAYKKYVNKTPN